MLIASPSGADIESRYFTEALSPKGSPVSTPKQYRAKAAEYNELVKTASGPNEAREFHELEQSFTVLADNEQWLRDNHDKTVHATQDGD
jgi:hypothetical protein